MKYTVRDLNEKAEHTVSGTNEVYAIGGHTIALVSIWAYSGGINPSLVTLIVDGKTIATRCKRELALRKALQVISE